MFIVYTSVRRHSRVANKWRLGFGKSSQLEQRVFGQALFYSISFYITWPVLLAVYLASVDWASYGLAMFVAFVAPLQGMTNFLVYVRPTVMKSKVLEKTLTHLSGLCSCHRDTNTGSTKPSPPFQTSHQNSVQGSPAQFGTLGGPLRTLAHGKHLLGRGHVVTRRQFEIALDVEELLDGLARREECEAATHAATAVSRVCRRRG